MTQSSDLHKQLDALGAHINKVRQHLDEKDLWNKGHDLTAKQLDARYTALKQQVDDEVKDAEEHGHHISKFEKSIMTWVEGLDMHK